MARLRVLVIGAGFIAKKWVETIAARPDVELVGVATRSPERGAAIVSDAGLAPVSIHADWARALQPGVADAVIIALPQHLHPAAVLGALDAGCHVLVEKPLAIDLAGVRAIVAGAGTHPDRVVMVNQNFRWRPHVQALRNAVSEGDRRARRAGDDRVPTADPAPHRRRMARTHGRALPARLRHPPLRPAPLRASRRAGSPSSAAASGRRGAGSSGTRPPRP